MAITNTVSSDFDPRSSIVKTVAFTIAAFPMCSINARNIDKNIGKGYCENMLFYDVFWIKTYSI